MSRAATLALLIALGGALSGCSSATTQYSPALIARGELLLRYDGGLEISSAGNVVASHPHYTGLEEFVRCVPKAARHARSASNAGTNVTVFSVLGGGMAVAGLGGIAGIAFKDKDPRVMWGLLGGGLGLEVLGVVFGALARVSKIDAIGHAVDAVNYYNDAMGSYGGSCSDPQAPAAQ